MKFILGMKCVPNEECFILFFPEYKRTLVPMSRNYNVEYTIRNGKYGIGAIVKNLENPAQYRNTWWMK